jgi:hypothetical protein
VSYKIELRYFYGWDDACWTEEKAGETKPMRFPNVPRAQRAIDEFVADVKAAVVAGTMDSEAVREDLRITQVNDG